MLESGTFGRGISAADSTDSMATTKGLRPASLHTNCTRQSVASCGSELMLRERAHRTSLRSDSFSDESEIGLSAGAAGVVLP